MQILALGIKTPSSQQKLGVVTLTIPRSISPGKYRNADSASGPVRI